jgi:hypothetical protein
MAKHAVLVAYVLTMVVVIVGVDVLLFRHHFWPRLMVNVGIVLVFGAFYLRFMGRGAA